MTKLTYRLFICAGSHEAMNEYADSGMTADAGDPGGVVSVAFLAVSFSMTFCLNSARRLFVEEAISALKSSGSDVN